MNLTDFPTKVGNEAKEFVERGWSCFPLSINDKRPLAKWKRYQTEFPTEEEIDDWIVNGAPRTDAETGEVIGVEKFFNVALVTGAISGFVVVDCDSEQAVEHAKKLGFNSPVVVKTSRGAHFYFKHPNNGRRYRNKVGSKPGADWYDCPGLDFRGDGGYVVAPPSVSLNPDGTLKHQYEWMFANGLDFDDMPVWAGPSDDMEQTEAFDFATLTLTGSSVGETSMDVREQIKARTTLLGRKLRGPDQGDATDQWMIRFCGQMVRRGVVGQELADAVAQFYNEHFEWCGRNRNELERWLKAKMVSAIQMDRRNHPTDYDPATKERLNPTAAQEAQHTAQEQQGDTEYKPFIPVTDKDYDRILKSLGDLEYHADPILPSRSIIQVVGYNGHGKSFVMTGLLNAIAANQSSFGPYHISRPSKVFYMDYDNPARTTLRRFQKFVKMFGSTGNNFLFWSPALHIDTGDMNLRDPDNLRQLERWLDEQKPDIVVIDTVRNAFPGMDEKDTAHWQHVGRVAKTIRNRYGATVVLVHHRNKPSADGLGREAGSTAQLTDIDTQIIITQVYKDKNIAKAKAGLYDEDCSFGRQGNFYSPFSYFEEKMRKANTNQSHRVKMVSEISYGKLREQTDLHQTTYLGWTENLTTGEQGLLHIPSVREDAIVLAGKGMSPQDIAQALYVPTMEIKRWLGIPV